VSEYNMDLLSNLSFMIISFLLIIIYKKTWQVNVSEKPA